MDVILGEGHTTPYTTHLLLRRSPYLAPRIVQDYTGICAAPLLVWAFPDAAYVPVLFNLITDRAVLLSFSGSLY